MESFCIPVLKSCLLLVASFLPWLSDADGKQYAAWCLPLCSIGGGVCINYGWLCSGCGACILVVAWTSWRPYNDLVCSIVTRGLCLIPVLLFLTLSIDASSLAFLIRHELQFLEIQQHFGYQATTQLFPLNPVTLRTSTFACRIELLLNHMLIVLFLFCIGAGLLPACGLFRGPLIRLPKILRLRYLLSGVCICMLLTLLLRAPVSLLCEYAAKEMLASGDYANALRILDVARAISPDLELVASYHRERGRAEYFLASAKLTLDSRIYLAEVYREQGNYPAAYQQLLAVWFAVPSAPWLVDEMDVTLEGLTESLRPLRGTSLKRIANDEAVLPWLQTLDRVDSTSMYSPYMAGRISYDLHNYTACIDSMSQVVQRSTDSATQSSAYTYTALCELALGKYADARLFLFKAVALDPDYHNNTAREELSGLH